MSTHTNNWGHWPATYDACTATYFAEGIFGKPGEAPADGNYMLACLQRYETNWNALHSHRNVPHCILDQAAAHEIYYHHNRKRAFRRAAAGLGACVCNLVSERPERIIDRYARTEKKKADRAAKQDPKMA